VARTHHHTSIQKRDPDMLQFYKWFSREPKWHRRLFKHRKRRAEWSRLRAKIAHGADLDNVVYPMDKRPWIYYW
jgi:hypothetical protein